MIMTMFRYNNSITVLFYSFNKTSCQLYKCCPQWNDEWKDGKLIVDDRINSNIEKEPNSAVLLMQNCDDIDENDCHLSRLPLLVK